MTETTHIEKKEGFMMTYQDDIIKCNTDSYKKSHLIGLFLESEQYPINELLLKPGVYVCSPQVP